MTFFDKDNYSISDIQELIDSGQEEATNLEFKSAAAITNNREIAKDVSALANSAGGIIIYGLNEDNHVAASLSFIDGNIHTKERLEQILNTNILRRIEDLRIFPIRNNNNLLESIYVIKVPESSGAPHMTSELKYYRRHNFMVLGMQEHEVRQAYNQRTKTELEILDPTITGGGRGGEVGNLRFVDNTIQFHVKNIGASVSEIYKFELKMHFIIYASNKQYSLEKLPNRRDGDFIIFSIPNQSHLFQDEQNSICELYVRSNNHSKPYISQYPVEIKLYYVGGQKQKQFDLGNLLIFAGTPISQTTFLT